jgi:diketogulonate reductase-like aldo/keto reductase
MTDTAGSSISLTPGVELPKLGFGVWLVDAGREAERAVGWALEAGYRHIDTAQAYENEQSVGNALKASGVPREEVFVTTKFFPRSEDPVREAEKSLERLQIDQIDLYLVHWPAGGPTRAWPGMVQALERGLVRSIGVSNFTEADLEKLLATSEVKPAVNQIQLNPFAHRRALVDACVGLDIVVEAYSPLTHGRDLANPHLAAVAKRVGRTPAQVLLRWGLQHEFVVLPKSVNQKRIQENAQIFDFSLSDEDMDELDALDRTNGTGKAVESPWW